MISLEIKFHNFHTVSHQMHLRTPSQNADILYPYACRLFDELWDGTPIRLLGIRTAKLSDQDTVQMNLFEAQANQKFEKLDKALDTIRKKYGKDAVIRGSFLEFSKMTVIKKGIITPLRPLLSKFIIPFHIKYFFHRFSNNIPLLLCCQKRFFLR